MSERELKLFDKYKYLVKSIISSYNWHSNADIMQDGYLILLNCIKNFDIEKGELALKKYISKTIKLSIVRKIQKHKRNEAETTHETDINNLETAEHDTETTLFKKEQLAKLINNIISFSDYEKEFLSLFLQDKSFSEIAILQNRSYKAVTKTYYKILDKIRRENNV